SRLLLPARKSLDLSTSMSGKSSVSAVSNSASGSASGLSNSPRGSSCAVCQDVASGVHYGVPTCEGCKGAPCVRKQRGSVAAHFANPWRPRAAGAAVSRREFRWRRRPQRGPPPESPGADELAEILGPENVGEVRVWAEVGEPVLSKGGAFTDEVLRILDTGEAERAFLTADFLLEVTMPGKAAMTERAMVTALMSLRLSPSRALRLFPPYRVVPQPGRRLLPRQPLAITPQTRNACQWCRLKKCCAVNMGRQRSKLGRRARLDADNGNGGRGVGGAKRRTSSRLRRALDQQLLRFIELKRWEFENQVRRRTYFRRQASLNSDKSPLSEAWLTGCQPLLSGQSLVRLCHRLTGDTDSRSARVALLTLRSSGRVRRFGQYWEADLNDQFSQNPVCGRAIAESTELILEGHRRTAYFCQDRMSKFRAERLPMLREPAIGEEAAVLNHLVGCIPQLMLRIVAFARNILGSSAAAHGHSDQQQLDDSDHNRVLASRCSDVLLDSDKRRLIVHHCFKVIAMRFCDALIQSGEGYIIDPALHYRLTKEFLVTANHPMLSQLFLKFFDVSTVWDSHGITEQELAFLSAICLTSPFLDSKNDAFSSSSETQFDDANAVVSVHSAVIGLFWIHLRSAEMTRRGCDPAKVKLDSRLNLELRVQALSRIMDLSAVFDALQSVDGVHKQNEAMIDSIVERLSASCSTSGQPDGFPDFSAAFNPVGHPAPDPQRLNQYGAGVYQEVFGPAANSAQAISAKNFECPLSRPECDE
uniref:Nuclear receptor domain-containing protein n=1 Tax=Macrostomum lignano TaxID=282301 RepID=A0A1I8IPU6_9PLAT